MFSHALENVLGFFEGWGVAISLRDSQKESSLLGW